MTKGTRVLATLLAVVFALAAASPVYANGGNRKCNSGNGNGSEPALNDCDPGNSGGHNNGGD